MRNWILIVALTAAPGFAADKAAPVVPPEVIQAEAKQAESKEAEPEKATEQEAAGYRAAIEKLGADDFQAREKATQELAAAGLKAKPFLEAVKKRDDAEVAARIEKLLQKIKAEEFLRALKTKGVVTLASGLGIKVVKEGTGASPSPTDTVAVNYTGRHENGAEFDSSAKHGNKPVSFPVNAVIRGWTEGLQKMKVGGTYTLIIPASLAYGENPPPGSGIAAGETLIFDIELVGIGGQ